MRAWRVVMSMPDTLKFREIRKNATGDDVLSVPENTVVKPNDEAVFNSFVWSADKLKEHLNDVVVLDARTKEAYEKEHLPGAVQAYWTDWSNVAVSQDSGDWAVIFDNEKLAELFAALGIDGKKPVVIYNDPLAGWGEEGRQLWTLRVAGLTDSYILNGGLSAWKASGYPVTDEPVMPVASEPPVLIRNDSLFASPEYLAENLARISVLDVREDEEYAGTKTYGEKTPGRIPNVKHYWFKDFYHADGTLYAPAEVRAAIERKGLNTEKEIVVYCTGGIRSGFAAIMLKIAGYDKVRNYNGSFSAWTGTRQKIDAEVYEKVPL
jgi:thiosulfate/3-mercaptopyruvate sulfurtransferase